MVEHRFSVVPRRPRLDDAGHAGRVEAREQHRRLDLRRRHGHLVGNGHRRLGADDGDGQAAARSGNKPGPHALQGRHHALHGARRERRVAGQEAGKRVRRQKPHQQARRGARVAHVENRTGLDETADAAPLDPPDADSIHHGVPFYRGTQGAHGVRRSQHVRRFQQSLDPAFPDGDTGDHQGAVRDRLVSGNLGSAAQRPAGVGNELGHALATPKIRDPAPAPRTAAAVAGASKYTFR